MRIGPHDLTSKVLVVAEIGNNHEGSFAKAVELLRKAADCGVDAVKFQTFRTEHFVSRQDEARFQRLKSFELSYAQFEALAKQARELGLLFLSTPFDLASAEFLGRLADAIKIASSDNTFRPLLAKAAQTGKPMIVSSGLCDLAQIRGTIEFIREQWSAQGSAGELAVLHCVCSYPVEPEQANLRAIPSLIRELDAVVGYSDHTIGIEACVLAVALGARILEKHFTLDHHYSDFRDHQLSADPAEMQLLVKRVRLAESLLGSGAKTIQPCERDFLPSLRRSVVADADLPLGHALVLSDLTWTRPGTGLSPGEESRLLGRTLKRAVRAGEMLRESDVE